MFTYPATAKILSEKQCTRMNNVFCIKEATAQCQMQTLLWSAVVCCGLRPDHS